MKYWDRQAITDRISDIRAAQYVIDWDTFEVATRPLTEEEEAEIATLLGRLEGELAESELRTLMQCTNGELVEVLTYEQWQEQNKEKEKKFA